MTIANWIEESEWNKIQQLIPIVCIDILPVQRSPFGEIKKVGLIKRKTPHEGQKWCTVGGRLLFGEPVQHGIVRQLQDTLGVGIQVKGIWNSQPQYVAQYSPTLEVSNGFDAVDPRKHAVALTYCLELEGEICPQNEALDFQWYSIQEVRNKTDIGFGQEKVIASCLELLENRKTGKKQ